MPFNVVERIRFLPLLLLGGLSGWLSFVAVDAYVAPEDAPRRDVFHLVRTADDPLRITAEKWLEIGFRFGDFDLVAEVELPENVEFDVVCHRVEPRYQSPERFHGRFDVVRLSTRSDGEGVRSREQALFDELPGGGIEVAAGVPATIHLQGRGHRLNARVAGRPTGWFESIDNGGSFAFVVRGEGTALLRYLNIQPLTRHVDAIPLYGSIGLFAAFGLLCSLFGAKRRSVIALAAAPLVAWATGAFVLDFFLPAARATTPTMTAAALSGLPLVLAIAGGARKLWIVVAVFATLALQEGIVRFEERRIGPFEDPRLAAHFGAGSGSAPVASLAGRLHAALKNHVRESAERRIVFAGGGPLYEAGGTRGVSENLAPLLAAEVGSVVGQPVDGVVVPTTFASVTQEVARLERFVLPTFRPDVVMFAVTPDEFEPSERFRPADVLSGEVELPSGFGSRLIQLWRTAVADEVAPGDATTIRAALDTLASLAERDGFDVVIYRPYGLSPELSQVVRRAANRHDWITLAPRAGESVLETARRLAPRVAPLLQGE